MPSARLSRRAISDSAISELATQRSEFSALLRSGGINALIASPPTAGPGRSGGLQPRAHARSDHSIADVTGRTSNHGGGRAAQARTNAAR
jgi:hypothetical protein